ncbi:MAG: hypothetical protein Q8Q73_13750 [Stagnimonas sp.]|nr:hypothetical protein [Stagnimonas sp.]
MDRPLIYPGCKFALPALLLLLVCGLPAQAAPEAVAAPAAVPGTGGAAAAGVTPKPAAAQPRPAKPRKPRPRRYSKATLNAYQPDPAQLILQSDTAPPAAPGPDAVVAADQIPAATVSETPLSELLETDQPTRPAGNKHRRLPAQEEAQALSRAAALPDEQTQEDPTQSEKAEGKVEQGLETGPMRLQVRKQAVQMSVEIPFK